MPLPKEAVPRAGAAAEDRLRGTASGALESPRPNALVADFSGVAGGADFGFWGHEFEWEAYAAPGRQKKP